MRGEERQQRSMLMVMNVEQRIPREHPLRRVKQLAEAVLQELSPLRSDVQPERPALDSARASAQSLAADGVVYGPQRAPVL